MALYAISDLHLALSTDKPMDIFGKNWANHHEKIRENWINKISDKDVVLIAGDISWSMKKDDSVQDLNWINELPGKKYLIRGNHDYWWSSINKLNAMYENMKFIQNNYFTYKDYAICGSRGWICPDAEGERFTENDEKIYSREQIRLRLSLDAAKKDGYEKIICMIHYPPTNENFHESAFTNIFKEYNVEKVVYGHLHGPALGRVINGMWRGIEYYMTSCDYLEFNPVKIMD